jgi:hypothetical protein
MDSKLTLKLDANVIQRAKMYAKEQNISLSKLIENYLNALTDDPSKKIKISPLVESLTGVVKLKEEDDKKDYIDYLTEKYS